VSGAGPVIGGSHRRGLGLAHQRSQFGDRLVQEDVLAGQAKSGGTGPGHDLDRQDRVATQTEEVVLDADGIPRRAPATTRLPNVRSTGVLGAT